MAKIKYDDWSFFYFKYFLKFIKFLNNNLASFFKKKLK